MSPPADVSDILSGILSDEGRMAQLREAAQEMASGEGGFGALLGMLGGSGGGEAGEPERPAPAGPDLSALLSMGKTLGSLQADDKNIALIEALEPHLGEARRRKAQEAVKVLRLLRLLPLLRESGLLDGLL